ncbi:MAG: oligosaccharide flippase family protein [Paraprevotella sp.]|nr:oligosaccharide flippase family protein [Paraprevotella sp.]
MANNKQIAKNLFFNGISFAINLIISFFFTPYLIRTVGKEAYSFFPLVNNMVGYSSIITTAIGSMAGRFITMRIYKNDIDGANKYLNSMWVSNLILSAFFTLISVFCVVYIDKLLTVPQELLSDVQWLFALGAFSMILGLLTGYLGLATYVKNRVDLSSSRNVICNIIRIICIFALFALFKPSIVYMSLSAVLSGLAGVYFNYNFKKKLLPELTIAPKKYFSFQLVKELTSSGVWNSVNQLSNMLLYQMDLLITNVFIGAIATGDYAIAKTAPTLILSLLGMLAGTFVPHFNILYAQDKIDELIREVRKSMVVVGSLISLPIGFLAIYSDCFYNLWVPGQDSQMLYWMTFITLLPMIFGGSVNPVFGIYSATNRLRVPSLVLLAAGILNVAVIYVLLKTTDMGIWAIIIVSAVQGGLRNALFSPAYGAICLKRKWTTFYPTMLRGIFGMLTVMAIGYAFRLIIEVDSWIMFFLSGAVVCSAALFINSYIIMSRSERQHLFGIVLKRIHR